MKNLASYTGFLFLAEQASPIPNASPKDIMDDYINNSTARGSINSAIQANANYNSLFNAIKNYWTKQIPYLKNKPKNTLTDTESNMLDTIDDKFQTGDTKSIEDYSMGKVIGGHSGEITYDKATKKLTINGYTETEYDKSIKSK